MASAINIGGGGRQRCLREPLTSAATLFDGKELVLRLAVVGAGAEVLRLSQAASSARSKSVNGRYSAHERRCSHRLDDPAKKHQKQRTENP